MPMGCPERRPSITVIGFDAPKNLCLTYFVGGDELLCDFFGAVEQACLFEGVAFDFVDEDLELEDDDEAD